MTKVTENFSGEIKVASRIVDYLSSGLYHSPAACLKELINNSYDADATVVKVFVKPDADRIIISDDGAGMDKDEFVKHFARVSESHKRDDSDRTHSGRSKIGKIGIGFIAANEICDVMEIFSTKRGSKAQLHVTINFAKMREPIETRVRNGGMAKADYEGEILAAELSSHYTHVFLKEVRPGAAQEMLAGANSKVHENDIKAASSLYGLTPESVRARLANPKLNSWTELDLYSQTLLEIGLNVPVCYHEDWLPEVLRKRVASFERLTQELGFIVEYDGTDLRKPIVFAPTGHTLIERFSFHGKDVSAQGYFYAQHSTIKPQELQGLLIRVRNAAVAEYDRSFLGFSSTSGSLMQRWISAEIWADDRLEDAMNIDRRTLRVTHPAYVELQHEIHRFMTHFISRVRSEIYETRTEERHSEKPRRRWLRSNSLRKARLLPSVARQPKKWLRSGKPQGAIGGL